MFESLASAWSNVKDGAVEAGAKAYINRKLNGFGSVSKFELDRNRRTMAFEVELKGEVSPIWVRVGSYQLIQRNGEKYIMLSNVQASREWIGLAVEQYVTGREFKLPAAVSGVL